MWLNSNSTRTKCGQAREKTLEFTIETLESRLMMAGNVTITQRGNDLIINGDDLGNQLHIQSVGGPGGFLITPQDNTTINNTPGQALFAASGNVRMALNGGNDRVLMRGHFNRDVVIDGGHGNNLVGTGGTQTTSVGRHFIVRNKTGMDTFDARLTSVGGKLDINNSDGGSLTRLQLGVVIQGDFKITNKGGHDSLLFNSGSQDQVHGKLSVNNGHGSSTTVIDTVAFRKGVSIVNRDGFDTLVFDGGTIDGNVKVDNGAGNTNVRMLQFVADRDLQLRSGHGLDDIEFEFLTVRGNTKITNGTGGSEFMAFVGLYEKNLTIQSRDGHDGFNVNTITVRQNATFDVGEGASSVTIVDVAVRRDLTIKARGGVDLHSLSDVNVSRHMRSNVGEGGGVVSFKELDVDGNLSFSSKVQGIVLTLDLMAIIGNASIDTGDGSDQINLNDSTFDGRFRMRSGGNADTIKVETTDTIYNTRTVFNGRAEINTGAGGDILLVGVSLSSERSITSTSQFIMNGGADLDFVDYLGNANLFFEPLNVIGFETES